MTEPQRIKTHITKLQSSDKNLKIVKDKEHKNSSQKPIVTINHLVTISQKLIDNFHFSEHVQKLYTILVEYINQSSEFEKRKLKISGRKDIPFSLKKGICLISPPGTGKSFIFMELLKYFFKYFPDFKYRTITIYRLEQLFGEYGISGWEHINDGIYVSGNNKSVFNLYLDDLGTETDRLLYYGSEIDFMSRIIDIRVRQQRQYGVVTHASSNLNLKQMREQYNDRTLSRMFELFNFIIFNSDVDFRML